MQVIEFTSNRPISGAPASGLWTAGGGAGAPTTNVAPAGGATKKEGTPSEVDDGRPASAATRTATSERPAKP